MSDWEIIQEWLAEGVEGAPAADQREDEGEKVLVDKPLNLPNQQADEEGTPSVLDTATQFVPDVSDVNVPTKGVALLVLIALVMIFAITNAPGQNISWLSLVVKAFLGKATLGAGQPSTQTGAPSLGQQWAPGATLPAIGNTQSGTWGNQWGGGFY